ncbi:MAG: alpha/beta fold hydrolase [Planctomycetales bacterium]|nr:alpha/beta fold hydrolase [Planctomycetales bacterium]
MTLATLLMPLILGGTPVDQLYEARQFVDQPTGDTYSYRLMKPAAIQPGQKYPLVLFLHGAGERGTNNRSQLQYFPERMASDELRVKYPAFVLAPQCRASGRWVEVDWGARDSTPMAHQPGQQLSVAMAILDEVLAELPVDRDRVYLTGLSMGGYGAWELAMRRPKLFAAVAPVCGGGDEREAQRIAALPIYAYHGDADGAVPVDRSRQMIAALKAAGGEPRYKELPGVGHNSWNAAYADADGVIPWMFAQRREK